VVTSVLPSTAIVTYHETTAPNAAITLPTFHMLLAVASQILVAALKYSKSFVEVVLKKWMPIFGRPSLDYLQLVTRMPTCALILLWPCGPGTAICTHTEDVMAMLKNFQSSTRQLHNICAHGKVCGTASASGHSYGSCRC
jgi:hypothetical protein